MANYQCLPEEVISYLAAFMHDKGHSPAGLADIADHLVGLSEPLTCPVYRGVTKYEVGTTCLMWRSFTERRSVAESFAKSYGTDHVIEVVQGQGFNYRSFMLWLMEVDTSFKDDFDHYKELLDQECEWFILTGEG